MALPTRETSSLVAMGSVDEPEQAAAPRTRPTPPPARRTTPREVTRLSSAPLEDVVGSLSQSSPSTSSRASSTSYSTSSSDVAHGQEGGRSPLTRQRLAAGYRGGGEDRDAVASIPSERDLYGEPRGGRRDRHGRRRHHADAHASEKLRPPSTTRSSSRHGHADHRTLIRAEVVDVEAAVPGEANANGGDEDALLEKMQRKEREFDRKIKKIDETFFSAGRQLVARDDIIEALQAELAMLRGQAQRRSQTEEQRYRETEQALMDRCGTAVQQLKEENNELRTALQDSKAQLEQRQRTVDQLLEQLTSADAKLREVKASHERRLEKIQTKCEEQLRQFDRKLAALQHKCAEAEADRDTVLATEAQTQAKLLAVEMAQSKEKEGESKAMRELWREKERLREEVEVVHLSLARLLQVMAEVPALRDYLQWNELDSNFVFLGYPTRYFSPSDEAESGVAGRSGRRHEATTFAGPGADGRVGTGVEDGIYTGATPFHDSKNIWLNGQWARRLQEIIQAENRFTRLHKIKLYELEEAGQLSDGLPNARDVLACRRQDRDYWVPYAIYQEAQNFKNRYYPKIPAVSHFYPFLMRLNAIWNRKLHDRLRTVKKDLRTIQQQQQEKLTAARRDGSAHTLMAPGLGLDRYTCDDASALDASPHPRVHLVGLARSIAAWESQYDHLRREVRIGVTGQRSLQLFKLYGGLFQTCLAAIKSLAVEHRQLLEAHAVGPRVRAAARFDDSGELSEGWGGRREGGHGRRWHGSRDAYTDESERYDSSTSDASWASDDQRGARRPGRGDARRRSHRQTRAADAALVREDTHGVPALSPAQGAGEAAVEALLCVIQHSCERVCGVADCLAERTQACCTDLEALLATLRDVYLPSLLTSPGATAHPPHSMRGGAGGRPSTSSSASGSSSSATRRGVVSGGSSTTAVGPTAAVLRAVQHEIRDMLRDQYGPDLRPGAVDAAPAEETAETAYRRAMRGMEGARKDGSDPAHPSSSSTVRGGAGGPAVVMANVIAAAFDFSHELREEVLQAQKALQVIAAEAMKDAEER